MQVVDYETAVVGESDETRLLLSSGGTVERMSLTPEQTLSYTLGDRHCVGVLDGDDHVTCQREQAPYCDEHTSKWPCARCRGNCNKPLDTCDEEHAIYLAAFSPATFKVGVTRSWRLETRLREQGADRAAHLRTVDNGRLARKIEAQIATDVGDSVRVATKIRGLHQRLDVDSWEELIGGYEVLATYTFDYDLSLEERPMEETLATGTVKGTQGRILVLDRNGSTYGVDMRDLLGYEIHSGETGRQLQSSLGAFD